MTDADSARLDPTTFFQTDRLLTQKDVITYEHELKAILEPVIAAHSEEDESSPLKKVIRELEDPVLAKLDEARLNQPTSIGPFYNNLIYLVSDLHAQGDLVRQIHLAQSS